MTLKLNWQVSEILQEIAILSTLSGENPFKAKAMQNGARVIEKLDGDLKTLFEQGELAKIKGIGPLILSVVDDIVHNRSVKELERLRALIPESLPELLKIPKLGPQKIRRLWQEIDVKSIGELSYAIEENRLKLMKGFGEKTQEELKKALANLSLGSKQVRLDEALDAFERFISANDYDNALLAGEAAACAEIVNSVEILALRAGNASPLDEDTTSSLVGENTTSSPVDEDRTSSPVGGDTTSSPVDGGTTSSPLEGGLRGVSSRPKSQHPPSIPPSRGEEVVPSSTGEEVGPSLAGGLAASTIVQSQNVTITLHESSNAHSFGVIALRLRSGQPFFTALVHRAESLGFAYQNDELFKDGQPQMLPTEESVFDALNLWYQPPCQRLTAANLILKSEPQPRLVTLKDLQGAFHNHTVLSDGKNTLEEMRDAAIERGLHYISINDHSQSAFYASGLKPTDLIQQQEQIALLNADRKGKLCHLFSGTESDILANGELDFSNEDLAALDVVIASVHSRLKQDYNAMTARLVNALKHPSTMILGHPTGRLLLSRSPSEFDFEKVLEAAQQHGVVMELNANPHRLDLSAHHLAMAKEAGVLIAINADAHSTRGFDDLAYGIMIAQRAGLGPHSVLNCRPLDAIRSFVTEAKKKVSS